MLRMYVMDKWGKWEYYLHLVEFAYNNNFQVSTGMIHFEILYRRKCNTSISWSNPIDRLKLGLELFNWYGTNCETSASKLEGFPRHA